MYVLNIYKMYLNVYRFHALNKLNSRRVPVNALDRN